MSDRNLTPVVYLSGGLGNQLFQLAMGIHFRSKILFVNTSQIRGSYELHELIIFLSQRKGMKIIEDHTSPSAFFIKKHNLILRSSQWSGKSVRLDFALNLLIRAIYLFQLKSTTKIFTQHSNFGAFENANWTFDVIGYFQSELYASVLKDDLNEFLDKTYGSIQKPQEMDRNSNLMVHIRRGDYISENKIGMLSLDYFINSLNEIQKSFSWSHLNLFSNGNIEIEKLRGIPGVGIVSEIDAPSAMELLAKMRNARYFMISNSTLSWWAAFLCQLSDKQVFAPEPWFRSLPEPVKLVPSRWDRFPALWSRRKDS